MIGEDEIKFLSVNGIQPTAGNIANGTYPFAHDFYAVSVVREPKSPEDAERISNIERLIEWILSEQGQNFIEICGYVKK